MTKIFVSLLAFSKESKPKESEPLNLIIKISIKITNLFFHKMTPMNLKIRLVKSGFKLETILKSMAQGNSLPYKPHME